MNIIDVINGKVVEDKSVPVKGNRLADILPTPSHAKATTTLDGKGKYLTHRFFEFISEGVRLMDFARIPMLLGTDAPVPPMVPGKSPSLGMQLWRKAGVSDAHILAATFDPAVFLGMEDSLGTAEKGKIADLVLLEANTLDNITNTEKIEAVIINGHLFNSKNLKAMKATIIAFNKKAKLQR